MKILFAITILLFMVTSFAQQQNSKFIAGQYHDGDGGLLIFEDHTFMIVAYATAIRGKLTIHGNEVIFNPIQKEPFSVYGRKNENIKEAKMMFSNFEKGTSFMNYTINHEPLDTMRLIFNEMANCFSFPYIYSFEKNINTFYFSYMDHRYPEEMQVKVLPNNVYQFNPIKVYQFDNDNAYNDFAVSFGKQEDIDTFSGKIVDGGKAIVFSSFNVGNANEEARKIVKRNFEKDFEDLKQGVSQHLEKKYVFLNPAYREYEPKYILDTNLYTCINSDTYVRKDVLCKDGTYDKGDTAEYHNSNVIYKYNKITPKILKGGQYKVEEKPFFTVNCKD